jgi:hypothetical protein
LYLTNPGEPAPVKLEKGKTVEIDLTFDDSPKTALEIFRRRVLASKLAQACS